SVRQKDRLSRTPQRLCCECTIPPNASQEANPRLSTARQLGPPRSPNRDLATACPTWRQVSELAGLVGKFGNLPPRRVRESLGKKTRKDLSLRVPSRNIMDRGGATHA